MPIEITSSITSPQSGTVIRALAFPVYLLVKGRVEALDAAEKETVVRPLVTVKVNGEDLEVDEIYSPSPSRYWKKLDWSGTVEIADVGAVEIRATAGRETAVVKISLERDVPVADEEFNAWARIEPRCRTNDFAQGLTASTADPLWMLARQWQTGEFEGEDSGSPISVDVQYATQAVTHVGLGESGDVQELGSQPLEMVVEQEQTDLDWRTRVQIGQAFERCVRTELAQIEIDATETIFLYRQTYKLEPTNDEWNHADATTHRYLSLMHGKVVDGQKLLKLERYRIEPKGELDISKIPAVRDRWLKWCRDMDILQRTSTPTISRAWREAQFDYRFRLNPPDASSEVGNQLIAPSYRSGTLDWYSFNSDRALLGVSGEWQARSLPKGVVPTHISVGGTSPRWWEFEDAATNFGRMSVDNLDLVKMVLMEYVLVYGDDWFYVPLHVELGNSDEGRLPSPQLLKINSVNIKDAFGIEPIKLTSAQQPKYTGPKEIPNPLMHWEMFALSPPEDPQKSVWVGDPDQTRFREQRFELEERKWVSCEVLLIMPSCAFGQESEPLEEVRFLRDEGANLVWAVEHTVRNGLGLPTEGFEAHLARKKQQENKPRQGGNPRYRLATEVPVNWHPFVPIRKPGTDRSYILRQAKLATEANDPKTLTHLLKRADGEPIDLEEATVPRAGVRVQLTRQRVRWFDGNTYVWLGRKVLTGRGEGSSGLRFDHLTE